MKLLLFFSLYFLLSSAAFAQNDSSKKLHLGFYVEGNRTFLATSDEETSYYTLNPSFGIGLGVSADYDLTSKLSIAAIAGLSFSETKVDYKLLFSNYVFYSTRVYPINMDFRVHAKYALCEKKSRLYFLFGPSVMVPVAPKEVPSTNTITNTGLSIDLGLGFNKNLKSFRFAPEIRYSYGLTNLNQPTTSFNLKAHRLTLTLHFKD